HTYTHYTHYKHTHAHIARTLHYTHTHTHYTHTTHTTNTRMHTHKRPDRLWGRGTREDVETLCLPVRGGRGKEQETQRHGNQKRAGWSEACSTTQQVLGHRVVAALLR